MADPARFLHGQEQANTTPAPAPEGTIYTCPMHPQIRQPGPGNCPICGMALEPEMPSLEDEDNPELRDFSHRFWWTLPLTAIVFLLAMLGHRIAALSVGLAQGAYRSIRIICDHGSAERCCVAASRNPWKWKCDGGCAASRRVQRSIE